ncbi:MAG: hypothetical protein ACRDRO_10705, partial [Pseudonocardiaceae bacterium]
TMRGVRGVTNATSLEIVSRAVITSRTTGGHRLPAVGTRQRAAARPAKPGGIAGTSRAGTVGAG